MDEKYLTEKLNSIRNEMSHLWGTVFVTLGGAFTLVSTPFSVVRLVLAFISFCVTGIFINAYFLRRDELLNILHGLKMEEK